MSLRDPKLDDAPSHELAGHFDGLARNAAQVPAISTPDEVSTEVPLAGLVARFRLVHGEIAAGVRRATEAQIECGRVLTLMHDHIRATIGGGYWSAWVQDNCGVSLRQVQRYKKRWAEFEKINQALGGGGDTVSLLSQREMMKLAGK